MSKRNSDFGATLRSKLRNTKAVQNNQTKRLGMSSMLRKRFYNHAGERSMPLPVLQLQVCTCTLLLQ
jgi:hypothetical protein